MTSPASARPSDDGACAGIGNPSNSNYLGRECGWIETQLKPFDPSPESVLATSGQGETNNGTIQPNRRGDDANPRY